MICYIMASRFQQANMHQWRVAYVSDVSWCGPFFGYFLDHVVFGVPFLAAISSITNMPFSVEHMSVIFRQA